MASFSVGENAVSDSAIAKSFSNRVIDYLSKRKTLENKKVTLFEYSNRDNKLALKEVEY